MSCLVCAVYEGIPHRNYKRLESQKQPTDFALAADPVGNKVTDMGRAKLDRCSLLMCSA